MQQAESLYAGIDLHKHYAFVTVMDHQGYIQQQTRYENKEEKLVPALQSFDKPIRATVESCYGWYWLADKLEEAEIPFCLAHPKKVNAIVGKKKTDREDSKALADLLRTNLLPMSYIPTHHERDLKELLRFRSHLVEQRSTYKRRAHDILDKQNIHCEFSNIFGKRAKEWISNLNCPAPYQTELNTLIRLSEEVEAEIEKYEELIEGCEGADENVELLKSIPGIGSVLALTLSSEIGDVKRFKDARALASYAGVVPRVHSSGDKTHYGPVSKEGNKYIRWALAEAMVHIAGEGKPLHNFYEEMKQRKGSGKARVAVMNKLIRIIYYMLIRREKYRMEGKSATD